MEWARRKPVGKRLAVLGPAPKATGRAVKDALLPYVDTLDDAFERCGGHP